MRKTEVTVNNWPLRSVMVRIDISPSLLLHNLHLRRQLLTIALTLTLLPPLPSQVSPYSEGFAKSKALIKTTSLAIFEVLFLPSNRFSIIANIQFEFACSYCKLCIASVLSPLPSTSMLFPC